MNDNDQIKKRFPNGTHRAVLKARKGDKINGKDVDPKNVDHLEYLRHMQVGFEVDQISRHFFVSKLEMIFKKYGIVVQSEDENNHILEDMYVEHMIGSAHSIAAHAMDNCNRGMEVEVIKMIVKDLILHASVTIAEEFSIEKHGRSATANEINMSKKYVSESLKKALEDGSDSYYDSYEEFKDM